MNMTRDRVQSIVWTIVVVVSAALLVALTFRVNAVKSRVRLTERRIVAIQQEKQSLDTEFQTRANQQQLAAMNAVDFGLKAPTAAQYVSGDRQLAALSAPIPPAFTPGTPAPVEMAMADVSAKVPAPVSANVPAIAASPRVPAQAASGDFASAAPHAAFADRMLPTVRNAAASRTASAVRVASATGSLPRLLGPIVNRGLAVGAGTRLLSDRDEVRARPAGHGALARAEKPDLPHPAIRQAGIRPATSSRPLPAPLAAGENTARKRAPVSIAIKDAPPKKALARRPAQANADDSGPANLLPAKWAPAKAPARTTPKHQTSERLALGDDAGRAAARSPKR